MKHGQNDEYLDFDVLEGHISSLHLFMLLHVPLAPNLYLRFMFHIILPLISSILASWIAIMYV